MGKSTQAAGSGGSHGADVTGGMASKVQQSLALAGEIAGLEIAIFSGEKPGRVRQALLGMHTGTRVRGDAAGCVRLISSMEPELHLSPH